MDPTWCPQKFNEMEKFERENQFFIKAVRVAHAQSRSQGLSSYRPLERSGRWERTRFRPCWEERLEIRVEQITSVLTLHPSSNNWPEEIVKLQEVANLEECEDPEYQQARDRDKEK